MIFNGIGQMFRKPLRLLLFLALIFVAVIFLVLGINIFSSTSRHIEEINKTFRTIGVIEQKPTGFSEVKEYDAVLDSYSYISNVTYGDSVPLKSFNFDGANYIYPPENRPFYYAKSPEYVKTWNYSVDNNQSILLEYKVLETYEGVVPVKAEVTRVLSGPYNQGDIIWVCQHNVEDPVVMEVGKTYVSGMMDDYNDIFLEDLHKIEQYTSLRPLNPYTPLWSLQLDKEGNHISDVETGNFLKPYEVSENFYETDDGKRIEHYGQSGSEADYYARITPITSLELLMAFYNRNVMYTSGREMTQEELDNGEAVCMIDEAHAEMNNLKVGDTITFDYVAEVYGYSLGTLVTKNTFVINYSSVIDRFGIPFEPFFKKEYKIVGIYKEYGGDTADSVNPYRLGYGTVLVPKNSITASAENNMSGYSKLSPYNVSFEIPNGTSGEYMKKIFELGLDKKVNITFYDRGYENIKKGLINIRTISIVLILTGAITTLAVMLFFFFIYISKEKKRTAIERSLGVTKRRCAVSLIFAVMTIITIGTFAGVSVGYLSSGYVMEMVEEASRQEAFETTYSNWASSGGDSREEIETMGITTGFAEQALLFLAIVAAAFVLALYYVNNSLKKEPLMLLSGREN